MVNQLEQSLIFILFFVVYTSARRPSEFCNGIESPALPLPVDENGNILYHLIVQRGPHYQFSLNDPPVSSSGVDKVTALSLDLNQSPPDEDK